MSDQERTEKATPRRESEARDKGQVARSQDLTTAVLMLTAAIILAATGPNAANMMTACMTEYLALPVEPNLGILEATALFRRLGGLMLAVVGPMAGFFLAVSLATGVAQVGWKFTPGALEFRPDKFNPVAGLKRLVNLRCIVRMLLAFLKFVLLSLVLWLAVRGRVGSFLALASMDLDVAAGEMLGSAMEILWLISVVLIGLGLIDFVYQKWQHGRDLRMSKQEVKDETKNTEGDPMIKSRIRQAQRRIARLRMMQNVPKADVVITNPTHAAVALEYDQEVMAAPRVTAKGWDEVALRIRALAAEHGVPIVEEPPLARGLAAAVDVGDEVPVRFYQAGAAVLSHGYRLTGKAPAGPGRR